MTRRGAAAILTAMDNGLFKRGGRSGTTRRTGVAIAVAATLLMILPGAAFAGYVNYPSFARTGGLQLNGDAHVVGGALRLTDDYGAASSAFTVPSAIDTTQPLHSSFSFWLQDDGGGKADGFTFTIQNDSQGENAVGAGGGSLGYTGYNGPPVSIPPITNSVAVAFNIYGGDDIEILKGGDRNAPVEGPQFTSFFGSVHYAWVDYTPKKKKLKVYVAETNTKPSSPVAQAKVDLKKAIGGASAHAGFTGGTGGEYAIQDI